MSCERGDKMLIAQITDIHLGFEPDNPAEFNRQRLDKILRKLCSMTPLPDMIICTGDLTENGDSRSYKQLKEALAGAPCETYLCIGNHDDRDNFLDIFPETPSTDGFIQYVIDKGTFIVVVLDTVETGEHGGAFCDQRASWLSQTLDACSDRPVIIALHHPPARHGIEWMDVEPDAEWIKRLSGVLKNRSNIRAMLAGHVHRPFTTMFENHLLTVTGSSAPQVALDLAAIDPSDPDDRPMIVAEEPGYSLHHWTGDALVTFFQTAGDYPTLAYFDASMQPLVQSLLPKPQ
jgi:3',5'-cyclic AMP phosphodiesterase CpdA